MGKEEEKNIHSVTNTPRNSNFGTLGKLPMGETANCTAPMPARQAPITLHYQVARELFRPCPFCGEEPNVFQVPETRYGIFHQYGWVVECKNMGCIFQRPTPDQSLTHLANDWNKRF